MSKPFTTADREGRAPQPRTERLTIALGRVPGRPLPRQLASLGRGGTHGQLSLAGADGKGATP